MQIIHMIKYNSSLSRENTLLNVLRANPFAKTIYVKVLQQHTNG